MQEIIEWKMRWNRCPWGPKIDDRRNRQLVSLLAGQYSDLDTSNWHFDKTEDIKHEIKREEANVAYNEAIDMEENIKWQHEQLAALAKKHGKKKSS